MSAHVDSMFYVGEVPWHGLGVKLDNPPTTKEAIIKAGLNREVELVPIKTTDGVNVPGNAIRYVDKKDNVLGWVGKEWRPLQNVDMFNVFDPWVQSGKLSLHTAGSLFEGKKIWILGEINNIDYPKSEIVKGDEIAKFVLLSNSHVYGKSVYFGFTPIRVVCANTEAMAISSEASKLLRVRHNNNLETNLNKIVEIMDLANQQFEGTAEQLRWLASRGVKEKDLFKYYKIVLGKEKEKDEDLSTRTKNTIDSLFKLFENGMGQELPGVKGTWYAAYNSVSEWLNHTRGRNSNNRMDSLWFGVNHTTNQKAFETAVALAA